MEVKIATTDTIPGYSGKLVYKGYVNGGDYSVPGAEAALQAAALELGANWVIGVKNSSRYMSGGSRFWLIGTAVFANT